MLFKRNLVASQIILVYNSKLTIIYSVQNRKNAQLQFIN